MQLDCDGVTFFTQTLGGTASVLPSSVEELESTPQSVTVVTDFRGTPPPSYTTTVALSDDALRALVSQASQMTGFTVSSPDLAFGLRRDDLEGKDSITLTEMVEQARQHIYGIQTTTGNGNTRSAQAQEGLNGILEIKELPSKLEEKELEELDASKNASRRAGGSTLAEPDSLRSDSAHGAKGSRGANYVAFRRSKDGTETMVKKSFSDGTSIRLWTGGNGDFKVYEVPVSFSDTQGHWADADGSIAFAASHMLLVGTSETEFSPDIPMTRGMLVAVLHRLEGEPEPQGSADFTDVAAGDFFAKAAAWGAENGIVKGTEDGCFAPEEDVTREQFATFLYRYAQFLGIDTSGRASLASFADSQEVSGFAKEAMRWAVDAGLVKGGDGGRLDPQGKTTRAQASAIFQRFIATITDTDTIFG